LFQLDYFVFFPLVSESHFFLSFTFIFVSLWQVVGKILGERGSLNQSMPIVIAKFGFLDPHKEHDWVDMETINGKKYCIHPDSCKGQLQQTLEVLAVPKIDLFMMHNPEVKLCG
jgi:aryl-alcohol dehydrogenase-like predicted oxidoreductase